MSSKNIVVIAKEGDALDSQATIRKIGINFSTSFQRTDGTAQALRNMVEMSAIELFGRLQKLPYWTCLGVGPDNPDIKREMEDWFIGMERGGELVPYFQEQLRNRGFYDGPVDGQISTGLRQAITAYRRGVGLLGGRLRRPGPSSAISCTGRSRRRRPDRSWPTPCRSPNRPRSRVPPPPACAGARARTGRC